LSPHGGNVRRLAEIAGVPPGDLLDFSASINPLGPPGWLREVVLAHLGEVEHYPDPDCSTLVESLSAHYGVDPGRIVVGNGSAEIIAALPRVLAAAIGQAPRAVIPVPTYADYALAAGEAGYTVEAPALEESRDFALDLEGLGARLRGAEAVFIGRPNNPTGALCPARDLLAVAGGHPRSWFVVDEAFVGFVDEEAAAAGTGEAAGTGAAAGLPGLLQADLPNLVVLRSLTKLYAIPGLRLGFAVAAPAVAAALRRALPPWSVNALAQAVGVAALADKEYVEATRGLVRGERRRLTERLAGLPGLHVFPGTANYLLVKISEGLLDAQELARRLLRRGVAIRVCDDFAGLGPEFFRVAVRTGAENARLIAELQAALDFGREEPVPKGERVPR